MNAKKALEAYEKMKDKNLSKDEWIAALQEWYKNTYDEDYTDPFDDDEPWEYDRDVINAALDTYETLKDLFKDDEDVSVSIDRPSHMNRYMNYLNIVVESFTLALTKDQLEKLLNHCDGVEMEVTGEHKARLIFEYEPFEFLHPYGDLTM